MPFFRPASASCAVLLLALALAACDTASVDGPGTAPLPGGATVLGETESPPPPVPPVLSVTDLGVIGQHPAIKGRDGGFSALVGGRSVWTFGDTPLNVTNANGDNWVDNSLAWTADRDASDGITLEGNYLDATGTPAEFIPYLPWERAYNDAHDGNPCQQEPCGAEFAFWPGEIVPDPARDRVLVFYGEIWRSPSQPGWRNVGRGIAVGRPDGSAVTRPIQNPGSRTPTLMWDEHDRLRFDAAAVVVNDVLFSYACAPGFFEFHCRVGRVPLANVLDKSAWRYYAGNGRWSAAQADAVTVLDGGANSVFYVPYLNAYMAVYNGVFSNDVFYHVSPTPWGPWSEQALLFTGRPGWNGGTNNTAHAHPEFAEQDGRVQYITYAHPSGFFRSDFPLVRVVFGGPAH